MPGNSTLWPIMSDPLLKSNPIETIDTQESVNRKNTYILSSLKFNEVKFEYMNLKRILRYFNYSKLKI